MPSCDLFRKKPVDNEVLNLNGFNEFKEFKLDCYETKRKYVTCIAFKNTF